MLDFLINRCIVFKGKRGQELLLLIMLLLTAAKFKGPKITILWNLVVGAQGKIPKICIFKFLPCAPTGQKTWMGE